jgi:hypothetical protein
MPPLPQRQISVDRLRQPTRNDTMRRIRTVLALTPEWEGSTLMYGPAAVRK